MDYLKLIGRRFCVEDRG